MYCDQISQTPDWGVSAIFEISLPERELNPLEFTVVPELP